MSYGSTNYGMFMKLLHTMTLVGHQNSEWKVIIEQYQN